MRVARRHILALAALPAIARAQAPAAGADRPATDAAPDPRLTPRYLGSEDAKVQVIELFSLTCSHCAAFSRETLPKVKTELIDTGKVRLQFIDFPLDQLALRAAMVARALPPERYEPFVVTLLATQDRWAFNRRADPKEELGKLAALAGMSAATFDATWTDEAFARAILERQLTAEKEWNVNSTPSFVIDGKTTAGAIGYDRFAELVAAAMPG